MAGFGDRSIISGPEFGGADGLNVSGQVQTAIIADWSFGADSGGSMVSSVGPDGIWVFRLGFFDAHSNSGNGGSSMTDNWFAQVRAENLLGTNLYGSAGYEQIDVNGSSENIISVGAGWRWNELDLSLEYQAIDQALVMMPVLDDETQFIAEVTYNIAEDWSVYVDYAVQDEADTDSIRIGGTWMYSHVDFTLEYSDDSYDNSANDESSIDLRMAFSF